jgi:hypothetical protein
MPGRRFDCCCPTTMCSSAIVFPWTFSLLILQNVGVTYCVYYALKHVLSMQCLLYRRWRHLGKEAF